MELIEDYNIGIFVELDEHTKTENNRDAVL